MILQKKVRSCLCLAARSRLVNLGFVFGLGIDLGIGLGIILGIGLGIGFVFCLGIGFGIRLGVGVGLDLTVQSLGPAKRPRVANPSFGLGFAAANAVVLLV